MRDADSLSDALALLAERDPRLARALRDVGPPEPRVREAGFGTLLRVIVDQQVSTAAGAAIWAKVTAAYGAAPDPAAIAAATDEALTACGLSKPKRRYAVALAREVAEGRLDVDGLAALPDDDVRRALLPLPGIGPWTVDIYLMFALGRPDVWPVGDLALQAACAGLFELPKRPDAATMEVLGEGWRPWRSAASLLLWRWYGRVLKNRAGAGIPMTESGKKA